MSHPFKCLRSRCIPSHLQFKSPRWPTVKSFTELTQLVKDHLNPLPWLIMQRSNFNSRTQKESESVSEFVAESDRISEHCNFQTSLDDILCDCLVCGIREVRVQQWLAEPGFKFRKAIELVQSVERAEWDLKDLQNNNPSSLLSKWTPIYNLDT